MKDDDMVESAGPPDALSHGAHAGAGDAIANRQSARKTSGHPVFWIIWHVCTLLLVLSFLSLMYSTVWEYSTRRYLKGFSDAIVPAASTPIEKIQAILNWMTRGPARKDAGRIAAGPNRNPTQTLNYSSLLKVCGTATNAFINLADSAGLSARRLLLLDSNRMTKHVVAEVFLRGRWIIVDPVFRVIPRGPHGAPLTRKQLAKPAIFSAATKDIPYYNPAYNYKTTAHVHLARIPFFGDFLRRTLAAWVPGWSDSWQISLLLERNSLAALLISAILVLFIAPLRLCLRWYAAARLHLHPVYLHTRVAHACHSFVHSAG